MSRLSIFPPYKVIYPNDHGIFTAQAVPAPPMWVSVFDAGDVKADFSLEVDPAGSQTTGFSAHNLTSGIGSVELTVDDQCRPTSSNILNMTGYIDDVNGLQYQYKFNVTSTTIEVRDESNVQIFTASYSTVSGDRYKLEFASGFRLFRNDVLLHSRVGLATVVIYPQRYSMSVQETTAAAPTRIPPPRLIGNWQLSPFVTWTAPSHGSLRKYGLSIDN